MLQQAEFSRLTENCGRSARTGWNLTRSENASFYGMAFCESVKFKVESPYLSANRIF